MRAQVQTASREAVERLHTAMNQHDLEGKRSRAEVVIVSSLLALTIVARRELAAIGIVRALVSANYRGAAGSGGDHSSRGR